MRDSRHIKTPEQSYALKKNLAVWFVSRCLTPNQRENYAKELSKYMPVDIYGRCGTKSDPCHGLSSAKTSECLNSLFNSYKFYFAFENCNCDSYITEKFFKFYTEDSIFKVDIVPVVMGASLHDYESKAPQQPSFIYAQSYPDHKSLADYLLYLDNNRTAYLEYFSWKINLYRKLKQIPSNYLIYSNSNFFNRHVNINPICELCAYLHNETYVSTPKEGVKISDYFNFIKDCYTNEQLSKNSNLTFENLKNKCFFGQTDNDWNI